MGFVEDAMRELKNAAREDWKFTNEDIPMNVIRMGPADPFQTKLIVEANNNHATHIDTLNQKIEYLRRVLSEHLDAEKNRDRLKEKYNNALNDLAKEIRETNEEKGWKINSIDEIPEKLMLIVSEISEALEEYRKPETDIVVDYLKDDKPEGFFIELVDAMIRILHLFGHFGIDVDYLMRKKLDYNKTREFRHGGKRV